MPNLAIYTRTVIATAPITALRAVTYQGGVPAAGAAVLGFSRIPGVAGDQLPVDVMGSTIAETGGAIAAGAAVEVDALGRIITNASGVKVGRLAPAQAGATMAGQTVEIILLPS